MIFNIKLQVHVSQRSTVADHCRHYALSDPDDSHYQSECDHQHDKLCDRCSMLTDTLKCIEDALQERSENLPKDMKEELTFRVRQTKANIQAWKAHLLRYVNKDEARVDILEALDETSVFLTQDWTMKFIPKKFRESQKDWFAKCGITWHITVATKKGNDGQLEMLTFVHIFQSCSQEYVIVLAIISDIIERLKNIMPKLRSVSYRQDNAGCYRNGPNIFHAELLGNCHSVTIKQIDFSNLQGGKGACNRNAATIKSHMHLHLNEGNDITSPEDMMKAILLSGGVPAMAVTLCGPPDIPDMPTLKLDGVSQVSNVKYSDDGIRIWKAYKIGPGKLLPSKDLQLPIESQIPSLSVIKTSDGQFTPIKSKNQKPRETVATEEPPSAQSEAGEPNALFSCPEEGCTMTFLRHSSLEQHLDCGKHKFALERETIFDKAILSYAEKLEGQLIGIPYLDVSGTKTTVQDKRENVPMGWALRSSPGRKRRLSKNQKEYLLQKFQI